MNRGGTSFVLTPIHLFLDTSKGKRGLQAVTGSTYLFSLKKSVIPLSEKGDTRGIRLSLTFDTVGRGPRGLAGIDAEGGPLA
jgi:hypothetical protein